METLATCAESELSTELRDVREDDDLDCDDAQDDDEGGNQAAKRKRTVKKWTAEEVRTLPCHVFELNLMMRNRMRSWRDWWRSWGRDAGDS
jgi:hypothetical protein